MRYMEDLTPGEMHERKRRQTSEEEAEARRYRASLQALKDRMDLFGDEGLTEEEKALVEKHDLFFYPKEK